MIEYDWFQPTIISHHYTISPHHWLITCGTHQPPRAMRTGRHHVVHDCPPPFSWVTNTWLNDSPCVGWLERQGASTPIPRGMFRPFAVSMNRTFLGRVMWAMCNAKRCCFAVRGESNDRCPCLGPYALGISPYWFYSESPKFSIVTSGWGGS